MDGSFGEFVVGAYRVPRCVSLVTTSASVAKEVEEETNEYQDIFNRYIVFDCFADRADCG